MKKILCAVWGIVVVFCMLACTGDTSMVVNPVGENAAFYITADKTDIKGEREQVTVRVEATAKRDLYIELGTGSYKQAGAIWIECYRKEGETTYLLYNNLFGMAVTDDIYEFDFVKGDTIVRTLKFSRFPISYSESTTKSVPKGKYRVRVRLQNDATWTETDIVIDAR